jgi:predicted RNA-binding Zn-ribbon protein involved in translation (DUF1610 family)
VARSGGRCNERAKEWRLQHPKATLKEIEQALDQRLGKMRVRMLQDAAMASAAADIKTATAQERPVCPQCGEELQSRDRQVRKLTTQHNQTVELERSYGVCPGCGTGFFPLDEELALVPGTLTPNLLEDLVPLLHAGLNRPMV